MINSILLTDSSAPSRSVVTASVLFFRSKSGEKRLAVSLVWRISRTWKWVQRTLSLASSWLTAPLINTVLEKFRDWHVLESQLRADIKTKVSWGKNVMKLCSESWGLYLSKFCSPYPAPLICMTATFPALPAVDWRPWWWAPPRWENVAWPRTADGWRDGGCGGSGRSCRRPIGLGEKRNGNIQVSTVSVPRQVWTLVLKLFTVTSNGRNILDRFSRTSWEEVSFNFQHESTPLARYHKPLKSDKVFILLEKEWVSLSKATIKLNLTIFSRLTIVAEWKLMRLQWITWAIFSFWG